MAVATGSVATKLLFPDILACLTLPLPINTIAGGCTCKAPPHTAHTLEGYMTCVETCDMAANSVKESLPGLPDEPHPPNNFLFFKQK